MLPHTPLITLTRRPHNGVTQAPLGASQATCPPLNPAKPSGLPLWCCLSMAPHAVHPSSAGCIQMPKVTSPASETEMATQVPQTLTCRSLITHLAPGPARAMPPTQLSYPSPHLTSHPRALREEREQAPPAAHGPAPGPGRGTVAQKVRPLSESDSSHTPAVRTGHCSRGPARSGLTHMLGHLQQFSPDRIPEASSSAGFLAVN